MSKALLERRKYQGQARNRQGIEFYQRLLSPFININRSSVVFEIISDGLAGKVEPIWGGVRTTCFDMYIPSPGEQENYRSDVFKRRNNLTNLRFRTQHEIGKQLYQPTLFKVMNSAVEYYHSGCWESLDISECQLPLKVGMDDESGRDEVILEIQRSLLTVHNDVLWPALLRSSSAEKISLIFILASMWHVTGVWALHACSETNKKHSASSSVKRIVEIVAPPAHCLMDMLGASFERDSTHHQRVEDVKLYLRCKGYTEPEIESSDELTKLRDDELNVYNRVDLPFDRSERYRQVYKAVCSQELGNNYCPHKTLPAKPFLRIIQALEHTFVGWHLMESAIENGSNNNTVSIIGELSIQATVRLCLNILNTQSIKDFLIAQPKWLRDRIEAAEFQAQSYMDYVEGQITEKLEINKQQLACLLASCLSCSILANEEQSDAVLWCSKGLCVLLRSIHGTTGVPTRGEYTTWQIDGNHYNGKIAVLAEMLRTHRMEDEAIWYIFKLVYE
jgi:hypothetical protein